MAVEAIVVSIGEERMVIPTEIAKKLYKELEELFGKKEKEYIPWPTSPTIIYRDLGWSQPYYSNTTLTLSNKETTTGGKKGIYTIDCAADAPVSASYSMSW